MSHYLSPSAESLSLYSFTMVVQLECTSCTMEQPLPSTDSTGTSIPLTRSRNVPNGVNPRGVLVLSSHPSAQGTETRPCGGKDVGEGHLL